MEFYGDVRGVKGIKRLNFSGDPGHHADCPIENPATTQQSMSNFYEMFRIALQ